MWYRRPSCRPSDRPGQPGPCYLRAPSDPTRGRAEWHLLRLHGSLPGQGEAPDEGETSTRGGEPEEIALCQHGDLLLSLPRTAEGAPASRRKMSLFAGP